MKENGLKESTELNKFPVVYRQRGDIIFRFDTDASINNKYKIILYEYIKGKPIPRNKSFGYWKYGDRITFNTNNNYYVVDEKQYMLEVTFYNINNIEVSDCVYIQVK